MAAIPVVGATLLELHRGGVGVGQLRVQIVDQRASFDESADREWPG